MSNESGPWRPEFLAALRILARVSEAMDRRGLPRPVLVGGGAAEYYSGSALMTGDIDVTSPVQPELEEELQKAGFVRPSGAGKSLRGWVHPELGFGFEVVANAPMDGAAQSTRFQLIKTAHEQDLFRVISVEDLIADRIAQFSSGSAVRCWSRHDCSSVFMTIWIAIILNREFMMKQQRNMASKSSSPEKIVDMAEFGKELIRRRAKLGNPELPRNSGKRRTASKRALLKEIEKAGGRW